MDLKRTWALIILVNWADTLLLTVWSNFCAVQSFCDRNFVGSVVSAVMSCSILRHGSVRCGRGVHLPHFSYSVQFWLCKTYMHLTCHGKKKFVTNWIVVGRIHVSVVNSFGLLHFNVCQSYDVQMSLFRSLERTCGISVLWKEPATYGRRACLSYEILVIEWLVFMDAMVFDVLRVIAKIIEYILSQRRNVAEWLCLTFLKFVQVDPIVTIMKPGIGLTNLIWHKFILDREDENLLAKMMHWAVCQTNIEGSAAPMPGHS